MSKMTGIFLKSPYLSEVLFSILENVDDNDEEIVALSIVGIGHMARRFSYIDDYIKERVKSSCMKFESEKISGAIEVMQSDIDQFIR